MIAYSDLDTLGDEEQERIQSLFERSATIWDLPEDEGKIDVWDEFVEDCERASFPHLIASARFGQYTPWSRRGSRGGPSTPTRSSCRSSTATATSLRQTTSIGCSVPSRPRR